MNLPIQPVEPAEPAIKLDPRTYARGLGCIHCGLCLPACPTYTETGNEADSPRGRSQLMLGLADGRLELTHSAKHHLDLCLDCRACETACPSGVVYHELIEETRTKIAHLESQTRPDERRPSASDDVDRPSGATVGAESKLLKQLFLHLLTRPGRLKLAMLPARMLQKLGLYHPIVRASRLNRLLPPGLRKMEQMLPPARTLLPVRLPERTPARGATKARVAFFQGCVGQVTFDQVNRKAVELLAACGAEVLVLRAERCCGAIHHHNAEEHGAMELARRNIDAYLNAPGGPPEMIVNTIAGCGAMLREYDTLLRDDPAYAEKARQFVARVRDISEALETLGLPEMPHRVERSVTYHDACHLAHAQRITIGPRKLLGQVPGLRLVALPESDMCCGAAGTYNLTQPEMATRLASRKLKHIASTGCNSCVTGNVGCAMHIASEAAARGQDLTVQHPLEILHEAVFGPEAR